MSSGLNKADFEEKIPIGIVVEMPHWKCRIYPALITPHSSSQPLYPQ